MGSVYEAEHTGLGRRFALKTLNPEYADDDEVRARFLREGQALARIRHPNIVGVSHVGTAAGVSYLVMDYPEGEELAQRIARRGRPRSRPRPRPRSGRPHPAPLAAATPRHPSAT